VLKQALLQASGAVLLPTFLPELSAAPAEGGQEALPGAGVGLEAFIRQRLTPNASDLYAETHAQVDLLLLPIVLDFTGGSQHQAARLLGIARQTLRQKLHALGLHVTRAVETDEEEPP
jgi:two-component system nitrogen regulation response regulator GlnG